MYKSMLLSWVVVTTALGAEHYSLAPGRAELFVDDFLLETSENLVRTLQSPDKDDGGAVPVIALEDEYEGYPCTLEANGSIIYDTSARSYVMFCIGYSPQRAKVSRWDCVRIYRFTSTDGLAWSKGDNGAAQCVWPRTEDDLLDAATGTSASNIDMFSCLYDSTDAKWPYKGWLYFANWGHEREGIYYMRSADGVAWERGAMVVNGCGGANDPSARRIEQHGHRLQGPGDVTLFSHDPETNRFLGLFKFYSPDPLPNNNLLRSRAYAYLESLDTVFDTNAIDHVELLPAGEARDGDAPADEYYAASAWRYGGQWLGGLKIYHDQYDYPWSRRGCAFLKLATSRDGLSWQKVAYPNQYGTPEVWIANGEEGGNEGRNDGGYITEFSQGPLRIGNELTYYYGASSFGKHAGPERRVSGGGIFRARLRADGFVSVDAGTLTTKLLSSPARSMLINAVGPIQVEVLAADGSLRHSTTIEGDALNHAVTTGDLPFRLRFYVTPPGRLYSVTASTQGSTH